MSEYQYYEFQAIDEPLSDDVQQGLRRISSRAHITPTGFVNVYNYGDLHADPETLLEKYFDAFCYLANWGTRRLMFRIPIGLIDEKPAGMYCLEDVVSLRRTDKFIILTFDSETEDYEWEEGEGWLSSMIGLREELLRGDFRCLYIAWLFGVQQEWVDFAEMEPPVPAGLEKLSGALSTFTRFMRIDPDLVAVAARDSAEISESGLEQDMKTWIRGLDRDEKDEIIYYLMCGNVHHGGSRLYRRFLDDCDKSGAGSAGKKRRTAGELLAQAALYGEERRARDAEEQARKQALLKKQQAHERKKYLTGLYGRETELWRQIQSLVAGKRSADYEQAVQLLLDLRDLAQGRSEKEVFQQKLALLAQEHRRKYSFIKKLAKAGFRV